MCFYARYDAAVSVQRRERYRKFEYIKSAWQSLGMLISEQERKNPVEIQRYLKTGSEFERGKEVIQRNTDIVLLLISLFSVLKKK